MYFFLDYGGLHGVTLPMIESLPFSKINELITLMEQQQKKEKERTEEERDKAKAMSGKR